jgi:hypothetical protein
MIAARISCSLIYQEKTMVDQNRKAEQFRALHIPGKPLLLFNIWDTGSANSPQSAFYDTMRDDGRFDLSAALRSPYQCPWSADEVDRHRRGDRGVRVVAGGNHACAEEYAQIGFPTVFDRWREGEHLAGAGVQLDAIEIMNVISKSKSCCPSRSVGAC